MNKTANQKNPIAVFLRDRVTQETGFLATFIRHREVWLSKPGF